MATEITVGSPLIVQVDDISGSIKNPRVNFKLEDQGGLDLYMPAGELSSTERLALQTGSIMQVYVEEVTGSSVKVSLHSRGGSSGSKPRMYDADITSALGTIAEPPKRQKERSKSGKHRRSEIQAIPTPDADKLLNNLKTGIQLTGIISSCTHYAAFIDVGIFRAGKSGSFTPVNGMLHKDDVPDGLSPLVRRESNGRKERAFESTDGTILQKGSEVTVYVKEVYKNSGRITLSMDPSIDKAAVLKMKKKVKDDGLERRRSRRLRRQLEIINVGDTVRATVKRIVPEGVLVDVTTLGSLNVTGLIGTRDLPKQFELPADMTFEFQQQLLEQDFLTGREVTCAVNKVNRDAYSRQKYALKLLVESMGPLPEDSSLDEVLGRIEIDDDFEMPRAQVTPSSPAPSADSVAFDAVWDKRATASTANDLREIYGELCEGANTLSLENLRSWGDLQDILAEGGFSAAQLDEILAAVGGGDSAEEEGFLTFDEFCGVVSSLQAVLEGEVIDDSEELFMAEPDPQTGEEAKGAGGAPELDLPPLVDSIAAGVEEDDSTIRIAREIYDGLLRNSVAQSISLEELYDWDDVKELLAADMEESIEFSLDMIGASKTRQLDFPQFLTFFNMIQEMDLSETENGMVASRLAPSVDDFVDAVDEELEEAVREAFDALRGEEDTVSLTKFLAWEGVQEIVAEGLVTALSLEELVLNADTDDQGRMGFPQFLELVNLLDEMAEASATDDEDGTRLVPDLVSALAVDGFSTEEAVDEESGRAIALDGATDTNDEIEEGICDLFDELSDGTGALTPSQILAWEDLKEMSASGVLDEMTIELLLKEAGVDPASSQPVSLSSFAQFVLLCDDTASASSIGVGSDEDSNIDDSLVDLDQKDDSLLSDEEFETLAEDIFDELRGSRKTVKVEEFLKWEDLQEMIGEGLVSEDQVLDFIKDAGAKKTMSLQHLKAVFRALDVAAPSVVDFDAGQNGLVLSDNDEIDVDEDEGEDEDEVEFDVGDLRMSDIDEELAMVTRECFDELANGRDSISAETFLNWSAVRDMVKDGILTESALQSQVAGLLADSTNMDFAQFSTLVDAIDSDAAGDDDYGINALEFEQVDMGTEGGFGGQVEDEEDEEEEEYDDEELEAISRNIFDELCAGKSLLTVKKFKNWEGVVNLIESGEIKKSEVLASLNECGIDPKSGEMDFDAFQEVLDLMEEIMEAKEEGETMKSLTTASADYRGFGGDGTGTSSSSASGGSVTSSSSSGSGEGDSAITVEEEFALVATDIFNALAEGQETISVEEFKEWEDIQSMVQMGALKLSTLERALQKVGSLESRLITLSQFIELMDVVQEKIDPSNLNFPRDEEDESLEDADDEEEEEEGEYQEIDNSPDEMRHIFLELSGGLSTVPLATLLAWEDLKEILSQGILGQKDLDRSLQASGVFGKDQLTFEDFSVFLDSIENYLDHEKLTAVAASTSEAIGDEDDTDGETLEELTNELTAGVAEMDVSDDDEIREMFNELREKNDEFVTEAALRSWEEVTELVESGFATQEMIDENIARLKISDGKINLPTFAHFVDMIDETLLDDDEALE
jgi:hypothetical protein